MSKRKKLTYDEAVAMLPNKENIHTFIEGMFLIGADWSRKDILSLLKNAVQIELSGQTAGYDCAWQNCEAIVKLNKRR